MPGRAYLKIDPTRFSLQELNDALKNSFESLQIRPKGGRPSWGHLIYLACYLASLEWNSKTVSQYAMVQRVEKLLNERALVIAKLDPEQAKQYQFGRTTIKHHVAIWLSWRCGAQPKDIPQASKTEHWLLERQRPEARLSRFCEGGPPQEWDAISPDAVDWFHKQASFTRRLKRNR